MSIRTASMHRRIEKNGAALHQAMTKRIQSHGEASEPSEEERALAEERHHLKEENARRHELAQQPRAKADKLVRTHHAEPKEKDKPKAHKESKEKVSKEAKPGKPKPSRAQKQAAKAAALDAAKKAARKSAKT